MLLWYILLHIHWFHWLLVTSSFISLLCLCVLLSVSSCSVSVISLCLFFIFLGSFFNLKLLNFFRQKYLTRMMEYMPSWNGTKHYNHTWVFPLYFLSFEIRLASSGCYICHYWVHTLFLVLNKYVFHQPFTLLILKKQNVSVCVANAIYFSTVNLSELEMMKTCTEIRLTKIFN